MSHSPLHLNAIRLSGRSRSASGRLGVNPCSALTTQYCASGFTPARSNSSCTATPSKVLSSRLHRVTQWMSQCTTFRGSSSSSAYVNVKGWSTNPETSKVQVLVSTLGTSPYWSRGHLVVMMWPVVKRLDMTLSRDVVIGILRAESTWVLVL